MTKKLKRWGTLALCCLLVLALAACGGGGDPSSQGGGIKGRYVETEITPPGCEGEILTTFVTPQGHLVCYNEDLTRRFESADGGENWDETPGPGIGGAGRIDNLCLLGDGSLLGAVYVADGGVERLVKIAPDGTTEPFSVPALDEALASGQMTYIDMLKVLSDSRLLLSFSSGDFGMPAAENGDDEPGDADAPDSEADPDGTDTPDIAEPPGEGEGEDNSTEDGAEDGGRQMSVGGGQTHFVGLVDLASGNVVAEFSDWYGISAASDGETLYLLDYNGEVLTRSLADGKAADGEGQVPIGEFAFNSSVAADKDGNLYVLDGKRIHKLPAGGEAETLLDGSAYSFSGPGSLAAGLHLLEGGDLVLNLLQGKGSHLYRYTWDENATLDESQILRVWSLYDNSLMRAAISALRRQNPDIVVEYEVALTEDAGMTAEDAIKNLNTRLLNGDGPDVMLLDGCPADSYAQRGMLMDLTDLVDVSGMFPNIVDPFKTDGGLYALPMNFKLPLLLGSGENTGGLNDLTALAERVQSGNDLPVFNSDEDVFAEIPEAERPVLMPESLREIFDLLWQTGASNVITEEGLDSEALRTLLTNLQAISDKYGLGEETGGATAGAMAMMGSDGTAATVQGAVLAYASGRALLGAYLADDMQMLQFMMDPPGTEMVSFPGQTGGSFVPVSLAGINAGTGKSELAAQFVQTMLGDEVQGSRTGAGFPVTAGGFEKQIADIDEMMREYQDEPFSFDYKPLVALAQHPQQADEVVTGMVWEAAESLCRGESDLEGAVKQLEQNLKNYLAERQ